MKESVAAFVKRTGASYAPAGSLLVLGTPLGPREACPTLFRFPGPEGLRDAFQGWLRRLAPSHLDHVWLTSRPTGAYPRPVDVFGTLAVLRPLRLTPCRTHCFQHTRDNWVAANRAIEDPDELVWVPPSWVRRPLAWDRVRSASGARRRMGRRYAAELAATRDRLFAYLEELSELKRAGAAGPRRHWCTLAARERRALLARHGVTPRWTPP